VESADAIDPPVPFRSSVKEMSAREVVDFMFEPATSHKIGPLGGALMSKHSRFGPLSHIKVVELGSFIAGPFCGQLLADLGAEVIKIEPPLIGDTMRRWGAQKSSSGDSLWWSIIGRNKLSVTVDLRKVEGRDLVRSLILDADVLVENFRPGTLENWGLSPDKLRQDKPSLIVARVSGFGQTGAYSRRAGFGAVAEPMAGLRHLTGYPGMTPTRVGISIGDSLAGLFAAIGVLSALAARPARDHRGQIVDVSIAESVLAVLESVCAEYAATGAVRGRSGPILPGIAPSNLYPTRDNNFILIAANADGVFGRLTEAMGRPELASDPRYASHLARGQCQAELDAIVSQWTADKPLSELLDLMEVFGVPAGPVNDAAAVCADAHFRERQAVIDVPTENAGTITMQGIVPRLSETPGKVRWIGPQLGEHNETILRDRLNLSPQRYAALRAEGIV
jgi:crotonobetainyl-CoA:carnitine CoA-transferase CaiB-like acyl-CoA transferase